MNVINTNLKFVKQLETLDKSNVSFIVVHHIQAKHATVEDLHSWHLANGWAGIGYNEYITKDGNVYIGRGDNVGAHCADEKRNWNPVSYGISLEGDYNTEQQVPDVQFKSLLERLKYHQGRFRNAVIVPHRKLTSTECPGQYFPWTQMLIAITEPVIKLGSTGEAVKFLQNQLTQKGFSVGVIDGQFGDFTQKAVISYQKSKKLVADGVVGNATWQEIFK